MKTLVGMQNKQINKIGLNPTEYTSSNGVGGSSVETSRKFPGSYIIE